MSPFVRLPRNKTMVLLAATLCLLPARSARAQNSATEAPAHISFVDGTALLERDGRSESAPTSMPLLAGDRIRTQIGRVEILFDDGSTVHLDANTVVDFQSDEVIRLLEGRVRLAVAGANRPVSYRVDAPSGWVQIVTPGEYRISLVPGDRDAEVELAVLRGAAELVNEDGRTALRAGERAYARSGAAPSFAYVFNSASWDDFDRWSEARRDTRLGVSSQYLPETVQPYAATFANYGSWQYLPTYGHVWYPRVKYGWRPYYYGRWTTLRPWGWTWIGTDPWAWPTHHYGRWGFSAGVWFWIPGRYWSPAWVSWAYAPNYISWCPLGWNNLPVIGFSSHYYYGGRRWDPWHAWTVVPHHRFSTGFVNVNVVHGSTFTPRTRSTFVVRDTAPDFRGQAVPRSVAPIRAVGTRAVSVVPGSGSPATITPRAAVGARASGGSEAATAFRRRGSDAAPLTGPGYPVPARDPRASSAVAPRPRQSEPAAGSVSRSGSAVLRERGVPAATTESGARVEPRAIPRGAVAAPPSPTAEPPSRRAVPQYRVPSQNYRASPNTSAPVVTGRPEYGRAVPRSGQDVHAPPPISSAPPAGREMRNAPPDASSSGRAVPRGGPDGPSGPPAGYRSTPGVDRSGPAPSAPPPSSAGPGRPSGGSQQGSAPASARPRSGGGGQTTGAVRRR